MASDTKTRTLAPLVPWLAVFAATLLVVSLLAVLIRPESTDPARLATADQADAPPSLRSTGPGDDLAATSLQDMPPLIPEVAAVRYKDATNLSVPAGFVAIPEGLGGVGPLDADTIAKQSQNPEATRTLLSQVGFATGYRAAWTVRGGKQVIVANVYGLGALGGASQFAPSLLLGEKLRGAKEISIDLSGAHAYSEDEPSKVGLLHDTGVVLSRGGYVLVVVFGSTTEQPAAEPVVAMTSDLLHRLEAA